MDTIKSELLFFSLLHCMKQTETVFQHYIFSIYANKHSVGLNNAFVVPFVKITTEKKVGWTNGWQWSLNKRVHSLPTRGECEFSRPTPVKQIYFVERPTEYLLIFSVWTLTPTGMDQIKHSHHGATIYQHKHECSNLFKMEHSMFKCRLSALIQGV